VNLKPSNFFKIIKFLFSKSEYKFVKSADFLILSRDANKNYLYKKKLYCTLLDPLAEYLKKKNYRVIGISVPGGNSYKDHTYLKYLNISYDFYSSKIKNLFSGNNLEVNFWIKLFKKVNPKVILCIQPTPTMCVAAKMCNILITDVQHGFISDTIYYNLKNPYGAKGLPNLVLCWDKVSSNYLKKILPNTSSYVLGNPWIMKVYEKNHNKFISREEKKLELIISKQPIILVTLQWKKNFIKEVVSIPSNVIKSLQILVRKGWKCWIKFHPAHTKEFTISSLHQKWNEKTNLNLDNDSVHDVTSFSMPHLLKFANVHITSHSAAIIEAKNMGVPSYFWCNNKKVVKKKYKIKSGDTLEAIARSHKINMKKLMKDNNLESSLIKVGDSIEIYR